MKRGPYKLYLDRDGDGAMPDSTFYRKLRKNNAIINEANQVQNQNDDENDDQNSNVNYPLHYVENVDDSNLSIIETADGDVIFSNNQASVLIVNIEQNSWLREEYDEQTQDREIWFDAEDSPQIEDFDRNNDDEINQVCIISYDK
ncbi:uncharacterized protein LOC130676202 [Microplitis mediator]|uniref:uncharacterized protein LOC130676202 n=1 Tax=Microplitis mediator TaxID=375433 RepID=UPI0025558905|nr:uncharacterized protein LOC130676202 [Microplitis mediator]